MSVNRDKLLRIEKAERARFTAASFQEEVMEDSHKERLAFHDRISFLSAGILSLATTALISLKMEDTLTLDEYKLLFVLGAFCLLVSLACGLYYRVLVTDMNFYKSKQNWGEKIKSSYKSRLDASDYITFEASSLENMKEFLSNYKKSSDKLTREVKWAVLKYDLVKYLSPLSFIFGLLLVTSYYLAQLFNF